MTGLLYLFLLLHGISDCPSDLPERSDVYYFPSTGNDNHNHNGTSPQTPWRSLDKLHVVKLRAGDSILLERGSVFTGTPDIQGQGLKGYEIYVGAYGVGEKPVISSTEIKNWVRFDKNIWVASCEPGKPEIPLSEKYIDMNGNSRSGTARLSAYESMIPLKPE